MHAPGAGKTYTMLGGRNSPGLMPQTLQSMFEDINDITKQGDLLYKAPPLPPQSAPRRPVLHPSVRQSVVCQSVVGCLLFSYHCI